MYKVSSNLVKWLKRNRSGQAEKTNMLPHFYNKEYMYKVSSNLVMWLRRNRSGQAEKTNMLPHFYNKAFNLKNSVEKDKDENMLKNGLSLNLTTMFRSSSF